MIGTAPTLLLLLALLSVPAPAVPPGGGGGGKGAPPPAPAAGDDWETVQNEEATVEFRCPPGSKPVPITRPEIQVFVRWEGAPYKSSQVRVFGHKGWKPENQKEYMSFVEKDVGGVVVYDDGSTTRFSSDLKQGEYWWVQLVDVRFAGGFAYYINVQAPKEVYDEQKEAFAKIRESFKATPPAPETFEIPATSKVVRNEFYAVLAPVSDVKDPKARKALENRQFRVLTWLDPVTAESLKMIREVTGDTRKHPPRFVIHLSASTGEFRKEAGDLWEEGVSVLYLPDSKDRVVLVAGSPDVEPVEEALVVEVGVQWMEGRVGPLPPWLRAAFRHYFRNGFRCHCGAGVFPEEAKRRGKEVFAKVPVPFDDLAKKDAAGMKALGPDGEVAAWGYLQVGLHGNDANVRALFRKWLRDAVESRDSAKAWEGALLSYREDAKKPFKGRDFDSATRRFFKELKEEKEKK